MIELRKGQKIDLTKKDGSSLSHILFGLGWKEASKGLGKGLFGRLKKSAQDIDIDASVFLIDSTGKINGTADVVYYSHKDHASKSVHHCGDNLVGGTMNGMADSEQIEVDLPKVPANIARLAFVVNIYDCRARNQHFGMIRDAYIRIVDRDANTELARYNLTEDYDGRTSIIVGEAVRNLSGWSFEAVGLGRDDPNIAKMIDYYNHR